MSFQLLLPSRKLLEDLWNEARKASAELKRQEWKNQFRSFEAISILAQICCYEIRRILQDVSLKTPYERLRALISFMDSELRAILSFEARLGLAVFADTEENMFSAIWRCSRADAKGKISNISWDLVHCKFVFESMTELTKLKNGQVCLGGIVSLDKRFHAILKFFEVEGVIFSSDRCYPIWPEPLEHIFKARNDYDLFFSEEAIARRKSHCDSSIGFLRNLLAKKEISAR